MTSSAIARQKKIHHTESARQVVLKNSARGQSPRESQIGPALLHFRESCRDFDQQPARTVVFQRRRARLQPLITFD